MLKIISNNTHGEILPNNLENKILEAGLTKRDVAAQKGVTPETLSRHMHGKIQLTLSDAEQYASILGCTAQSILFAAEPVPVRASVDVAKDGTTERIVYPDPVGYLHMHDVFPEPVFAAKWNTAQDYAGMFMDYINSVSLYLSKPIDDGFVDQRCMQHVCWASALNIEGQDGPKVIAGTLYPEPGGKFTVHEAYDDIMHRGLILEWATPVVQVIFRPDLRGMEIIDS